MRLRQDVGRLRPSTPATVMSPVAAATARDAASGSAALADALTGGDLTTLNGALNAKFEAIEGRLDELEAP